MTALRTAAQQALEALEYEADRSNDDAYRKERDALRAALAEPVQEPVAWLSTDCIGERDLWFSLPLDGDQVLPLYAAPPQRKPLTEEEIINIGKAARAVEGSHILPVTFARAIERAHGIKE